MGVLQVTTERMLEHVERLSGIPGAKVAFGGKPLKGGKHSIPACYGAIEPTAVFVPLSEILASDENFELATTEVFGPVQVRIARPSPRTASSIYRTVHYSTLQFTTVRCRSVQFSSVLYCPALN